MYFRNNLLSIILALFTLSTSVSGAGPLKEALQIKAGIPTTRQGSDEATFQNYINLVEKIEGVVYLDLQNKQTARADEILARARFDIPGSDNCILYVQFDGLCDNFCVGRLFLSDNNGNILDIVEGTVEAYPGITTKKHTMENGRIQIYSIIPSTQNSLLFEDFGHSYSSFVGTRCDEEYVVDGDKFKLAKRTTYLKRNYYYSELNHSGKEIINRIWDGNETVESVTDFLEAVQ